MRQFRFLSIARSYPDCETTSFAGHLSLTDFDIVVMNPEDVESIFPRVDRSPENVPVVNGKPAHEVQEMLTHRQSEVQALLDAGKIVVCFCTPAKQWLLNLHGGAVTVTNYSWLPGGLGPDLFDHHIAGTGREIRLVDRKHLFCGYYLALKDFLTFRSYFNQSIAEFKWGGVFLCNSIGQVIGFSMEVGKGILAFLPEFTESEENKAKFIGVLRHIAKSHLGSLAASTPPSWLGEFVVPGIDKLDQDAKDLQSRQDELDAQMDEVDRKRQYLEGFRGLLYEQGDILKDEVIEVFKLAGFSAGTVVLPNTDLDVVLECPEGRAIVEVEGKDDSAINKDKIDQLVSAINQDYEMTKSFAKGVLVGNPFRLKEPKQREMPFTVSVIDIAAKLAYSLLTTADLYDAAVYILVNPGDEDYKRECRARVLQSAGLVVLSGGAELGS